MSQKKYSDEEKLKAAYALNLCTVSVSQIVDYDNLMVLEQEYDGILNNLNLEMIPKDEPLLRTLKQILDTITFFRIQEGDKQILEKKYQRKVKNAIWSSVPNLSIVLATGNPWAAIGALATQVGIGYMNYRRAKAEANEEKEEQQWQLMRSAIEQFNALRRDLFDTAWRLADEYKFPDLYRLTEKQIAQYNQILMDTNPFRQYERLDNIRQYFVAYPPFWYYLGHAAASIATDMTVDDDCRRFFLQRALDAFGYYVEYQEVEMLRKNPIRCSGLLEYVDILHEANELLDKEIATSDQIEILIDKVIPHADNDMDTLQYVATSYLKNGCYSKAMNVLRTLVREGFNTKTNAIFLSYLYQFTSDRESFQNNRLHYNSLKLLVDSSYIVPWSVAQLADCEASAVVKFNSENSSYEFIQNQKDALKEIYTSILLQLISKYNYTWNKFFFEVPDDELADDVNLYTDISPINQYRTNHLFSIFRNYKSKWENYINALKTKNILYNYNKIINSCLDAIEKFSKQTLDTEIDSIIMFKHLYMDDLSDLSKQYKAIKEYFDSDSFDFNAFILPAEELSLFKVFNSFMSDHLLDDFDLTFEELRDINSYIRLEENLFKFCEENELVFPDSLKNNNQSPEFGNQSSLNESSINIFELWGETDLSCVVEMFKTAESKIYNNPSSPKIIYNTDIELNTISSELINSKTKRSAAADGGSIIAYINNNYNAHLFIQERGLTVVESSVSSFSDFCKRLKEDINILNSINFYSYDSLRVDSKKNALYVLSPKLSEIAKQNIVILPIFAPLAIVNILSEISDKYIFECESLNITELYKCIKECPILLSQSK